MPGPDPTPSAVRFPAGPAYHVLLESDPGLGWVRYKVWAADWYTTTLGELADQFSDLQPYVGLEMALDGALSSLSGAFDAAVALMIESAEQTLDVPDENRTPRHKYGWSSFTQLVTRNDTEAELAQRGNRVVTHLRSIPGLSELTEDVDQALEGQNKDHPTGWLAILRRFRNHSTHHSALPRTWTVDWRSKEVLDVTVSDIPGEDLLSYLKQSCNRVSDLTERMVSFANHFGHAGANTPLIRTAWT